MTDEITHKTFSQPPCPEALHKYLGRNFPGGTYYSAYEAGLFQAGSSLARPCGE